MRSPGPFKAVELVTTMSAQGAAQSQCRAFGPSDWGLPVPRHGRAIPAGFGLGGTRIPNLLCLRMSKVPRGEKLRRTKR